MNKQAYTMLATMLITASLSLPAKAQCNTSRSTANIPFQFSAGQTTLPAGQYTITCMGPAVIHVSNGNAAVAEITVPVSGKLKEYARLVFHRYGNRYFLAQAWAAGEEVGLEVPKSHAEREIERELASIKPANEIIALNALR